MRAIQHFLSNQKIPRRELEAAYLTESSMELKVSQSMTCHLGKTKKDQENLPVENYISQEAKLL